MLETAAPQELQAHYARAHALRAQAFSQILVAFAKLFQRKEKGPRLMAQPQTC